MILTKLTKIFHRPFNNAIPKAFNLAESLVFFDLGLVVCLF